MYDGGRATSWRREVRKRYPTDESEPTPRGVTSVPCGRHTFGASRWLWRCVRNDTPKNSDFLPSALALP